MSENDLKKRSGVIYLAVFLFAVCAVATVLMATAKYLTDPTIAKAELAKIESGLQVVLDGVAYNNQPSADVVTLDDAVIYVAKENGVPSGYAVKMSSGGYGGALEGLIGFDAKGRILTYIITKHNETPGIGTKVTNRTQVRSISDVITGKEADQSLPPNKTLDSFRGKRAKSDVLSGASANPKWDGIESVSGATVSSNAVNSLAWKASVTLNKYLKMQQKKENK